MSTINRLFNPLPFIPILAFLAVTQSIKLGIILSQPNSADFKYWFYQCFQYPPYSFRCVTVHGDLFPMAYSLLWYAVYVPLTAHGYWVTNFTLLAADTITGIIIARKYSQLYFALWTQGSLYFLLASPQDFLIWTMIVAGKHRKYGPLFLVLAVMTKLPLIPPIFNPAIWNYIAYNPYSLHDPNNWARYTLLGSYWLLSLGTWLYKRYPNNLLTRKLLHFHVNSPNITVDQGISRSNNAVSSKNLGSPTGRSHRTSPSLDSSNINIHSVNSTSTLLGSTVSRDHRTTHLRSHHPLRSHRPHPQRQIADAVREPRPKTSDRNPKLAKLGKIRRIAVPSSLFLLLLLIAIPLAHADIIAQYNASPNDGEICGFGFSRCGQCFTPGSNAIVSSASLPLKKFGNPGHTSFNYELWTTQGTYATGCLPLSILATSDPFYSDNPSIGGSYAQFLATFSGLNQIGLTGGTHYALTIAIGAVSGVYDSSDYIRPGFIDPGTSGANGFICNPGCGVGDGTGQIPYAVYGSTSTTPGQLKQCYGACGTIQNTNSTHTINFNNSVTIFYTAQSNLNGFILNESTFLAKSYINGMVLYLGVYVVDAHCTVSNSPFTPQCPGFLTAQTSITNPGKGTQTLQLNVPVVTGQWIGIAVSASFSGLDINNTSTSQTLYQTTGRMPTVVNSYTSLGSSSADIYINLLGLQPGGGSPQPGSVGTCSVSCGLIQFWNALGGDTAAGIAVFIILFFFVFGLIAVFTRHAGIGLPFGPILLLLSIFSIALMVMLSSVGVLPTYLPVVIIAITAFLFTTKVLFSRHSSGEAM
jgi:hypothetical protein